uniref:BUD13 homolog n=1 Tax=Trichuris muris TaxID=70415 RepID=A0A5S6QGA0_TRIMR
MSLRDYLKRYESHPKRCKKVTKKAKNAVTSRIKIIEEDVVLKPTFAKKSDSEEEFSDDEKPLLALQNNKTDELRLLGKFSLSRWTEAPSVSESSSEVNSRQLERRRRRHDSPVSDDGEKELADLADQNPSHGRAVNCASAEKADSVISKSSISREFIESPTDRSANGGSPRSEERTGSPKVDAVSAFENDNEPERSTSPKSFRIRNAQEPADLSPPRRRPARRRHDSEESDLSPPRKGRPAPHNYVADSPRSSRCHSVGTSSVRSRSVRENESRSSRHRLPERTRDRSAESSEPSTSSGRDAKPVVRNKMTARKGAKQETEAEKALREELEKRFAIWNKGVKQVKEREAKLEEMAKEIDKPLARYAGDEDLEAHLKSQLYEDDPMYEYMMRKRRREHPEPPQCSKGRLALPNRFSIPPGARWDGVDRSNGFETRLLSQKNLRQAEKEEYYKWAAGIYE